MRCRADLLSCPMVTLPLAEDFPCPWIPLEPLFDRQLTVYMRASEEFLFCSLTCPPCTLAQPCLEGVVMSVLEGPQSRLCSRLLSGRIAPFWSFSWGWLLSLLGFWHLLLQVCDAEAERPPGSGSVLVSEASSCLPSLPVSVRSFLAVLTSFLNVDKFTSLLLLPQK